MRKCLRLQDTNGAQHIHDQKSNRRLVEHRTVRRISAIDSEKVPEPSVCCMRSTETLMNADRASLLFHIGDSYPSKGDLYDSDKVWNWFKMPQNEKGRVKS